jgi:excisionase family DNA binding protein
MDAAPSADPQAPPPIPPGLVDALVDALAPRLQDALSTKAEPLLDLAAVAKRLNVSPRTVESLVAGGEIPFIRVGAPGARGVRRFEDAAVDAYIRRKARQA